MAKGHDDRFSCNMAQLLTGNVSAIYDNQKQARGCKKIFFSTQLSMKFLLIIV